MKSLRVVLLVLLVLPRLALGMGSFGDNAPDIVVPDPADNYRARVTDTTLNSFEVTHVSVAGHTWFTGKLGKAKVSVPFTKVKAVHFEITGDDEVLAIVEVQDGTSQRLIVDGRVLCYGQSSFGNVSIAVRDMRDVEFLGIVAQ